MSTKCAIGLLRPNGTVLAIYCHHDGYTSHAGRCLLKAYTTEERIKALLELGAISSIGDNLSKEEGNDPCNPYFEGMNPEITRIEIFLGFVRIGQRPDQPENATTLFREKLGNLYSF